MSLDGWSLDQKISKLREELVNEMKDLKVHFAVLYDYMKQIESVKSSDGLKSKKKSKIKN